MTLDDNKWMYKEIERQTIVHLVIMKNDHKNVWECTVPSQSKWALCNFLVAGSHYKGSQ